MDQGNAKDQREVFRYLAAVRVDLDESTVKLNSAVTNLKLGGGQRVESVKGHIVPAVWWEVIESHLQVTFATTAWNKNENENDTFELLC